MKRPSLIDVIKQDVWTVSDLIVDDEFSKYHFTATHEDGTEFKMSKTKKLMQETINHIENEN